MFGLIEAGIPGFQADKFQNEIKATHNREVMTQNIGNFNQEMKFLATFTYMWIPSSFEIEFILRIRTAAGAAPTAGEVSVEEFF